MKDNFDPSLKLTLIYEGLFSDNPRDPGGATMCGVTQRVYDEDRDRRGLPRQSVRLSTEAERAAIYRWRYWDGLHGDDLPPGVDYAVFDFGVNSGVARSAKILQGIVGANEDGAIGAHTLAAVTHYTGRYGLTALTDLICTRRMQFLQCLPTFADFGHGWHARVMGKLDGAQTLDTGVIDRAFVMAQGAMPAHPVAPVVTQKTYFARTA